MGTVGGWFADRFTSILAPGTAPHHFVSPCLSPIPARALALHAHALALCACAYALTVCGLALAVCARACALALRACLRSSISPPTTCPPTCPRCAPATQHTVRSAPAARPAERSPRRSARSPCQCHALCAPCVRHAHHPPLPPHPSAAYSRLVRAPHVRLDLRLSAAQPAPAPHPARARSAGDAPRPRRFAPYARRAVRTPPTACGAHTTRRFRRPALVRSPLPCARPLPAALRSSTVRYSAAATAPRAPRPPCRVHSRPRYKTGQKERVQRAIGSAAKRARCAVYNWEQKIPRRSLY
jgi:hypothetical protein